VIHISFSFEFKLGHSHRPAEEGRDYTTTSESFMRLKKLVEKRDGGICQYCGEQSTDGQIDHVVPLSRGGTDNIDNLKWACPRCNLSKGSKTLDEWHGPNSYHQQQENRPVTVEIVRQVEEEEEIDILDLYGIKLDDFRVFAKAALDGLSMATHSWVGPTGLFSQGQFSSFMAKLEHLEYVKQGIGNRPRELTALGRAFFEELTNDGIDQP